MSHVNIVLCVGNHFYFYALINCTKQLKITQNNPYFRKFNVLAHKKNNFFFEYVSP